MIAKKVVEMANDPSADGVIDEKKILKEAEEREKERKAEEEAAKEEEKKADAASRKAGAGAPASEGMRGKLQIKKPQHGKKYRELAKQIEKDKEYPIAEAIDLALKTSPVKFDATIEAHFKINTKEKNIRGMITLAGGLVKEKKVKEVTEGNVDEVIADVKAGKVDFDVMIAELKAMPKLAQLAKVLGPKGLMPSPKAGTAVEDVAKAIEELKSGKVEYRADKFNIVHLALGKISFGSERVKQNYDAILNALPFKKIETIFLTSTMGPSVKVVKK